MYFFLLAQCTWLLTKFRWCSYGHAWNTQYLCRKLTSSGTFWAMAVPWRWGLRRPEQAQCECQWYRTERMSEVFFFFLDILRILSQIYILYTWTFSIILNKTKWIEHKQRWYTILIKAFYRIIVDSSCCYKLLRSTSHFFWTSNKRCITGHLCKNKDCEKLVTWIKVSG